MSEGLGGFIEKGKELISEHPDQAKEGLEKLEGILDERTGGKYTDQLKQGEKMVSGQFGLPEDEQQQ